MSKKIYIWLNYVTSRITDQLSIKSLQWRPGVALIGIRGITLLTRLSNTEPETMSIAPRAILITGANRGLGLEFVKQIVCFSTPPKYLFATCRNPDSATSLQEIAKLYSCIKVMKFDVTGCGEIQAVYDRTRHILAEDGLNLIINNAGIAYKKQYLGNLTHSDMLGQFDVNVFSPLLITQAFVPLLKLAAQKSSEEAMSWRKAAVVNVSSILGSVESNNSGGLYPYRASKAALNMVTKTQSIDLKADEILAVAVHPGWVRTDMGGQAASVSPTESVQGMLEVFSTLSEDTSGRLFNYTGEFLPW
ncbi:C-factor-like isoform X1 [Pecten maximus]|uniref:C-factor-like isoform X1 n=1 Tax=Pecten maximus TaxID=6579 RepID=UPI001458A895|nr:C-factor-like isoform X1 [Pecten maximus]